MTLKNSFRNTNQNHTNRVNRSWRSDNKRVDSLVNDIDSTQLMKYFVRFILITVFFVTIGLITIYSASYGVSGASYFKKQLIWLVLGLSGGILSYYVGYKNLAKLSPYFLVFVIILLICAFFGPQINGAHRWIRVNLGGVTLSLQPSELTKIFLTLFLAEYCSKYYRTFPLLKHRNGFLIPALVTAIVLGSIIIGEDLGTTILVGATAGVIFFVAGVKMRYVFVPITLGVSVFFYILFFDSMRLGRIISFLDTEKYQHDIGHQLWMSKLALGSGSWLGLGFMCSRMKAKYLPEAHTDFILSVIGEESGYIGMLVIILSYCAFSYLAFKISMNAKNKLGMFIGFGLSTFISLQTLINILVVAGLIPTKGMPAPFISYGGSNLLVCLIAVGILLSIAMDTINENYNIRFYQMLNRIKRVIVREHE